jgi:hypothetical protein
LLVLSFAWFSGTTWIECAHGATESEKERS